MSFICSVTVGISGLQDPVRLQRRRKDSSLLRSVAELKPYHAGAQYRIFAMTVALKTSWSDELGRPWCRNTCSAYKRDEHEDSKLLIWSVEVSWSLTTTPRAVILCTRSMQSIGLGSWVVAPRIPRALQTISFDFAQSSWSALVFFHWYRIKKSIEAHYRITVHHLVNLNQVSTNPSFPQRP